jgi:hypothetical protein
MTARSTKEFIDDTSIKNVASCQETSGLRSGRSKDLNASIELTTYSEKEGTTLGHNFGTVTTLSISKKFVGQEVSNGSMWVHCPFRGAKTARIVAFC